MSTSPNSIDEPQLTFQRIGAGSFATVYVRSGTMIAYKQVQRENEGDTLKWEYKALGRIYALCNSESFFAIPRPIAFYDPLSDSFLARLPSTPRTTGRRGGRPAMQRKALVTFNSAMYAMERIPHLPERLASAISSSFYPEEHRDKPGPRLCRLYFGKVLDGIRLSRFFNSNNFPLDVSRYEALQGGEGLERVQDIAYGMGEMIGRIHWRGGYDARDIEFVLGGDGEEGHAFHVIDFNQMRSWSKIQDEISVLVDAHYLNDPYFPRARPTDPLYLEFKRGYLSAYPQHEMCQKIASTFLNGIEKKQAEKDVASTTPTQEAIMLTPDLHNTA